ncbi:predicted protein [Naegleria gruberi]|uniref:Predicted protein n=1 Tax=Naegleria gruberi TaxID=5762 RepID=D2VWQ7_NAEGR|nr:uncharacterized protein NAEGRDRAFT_73468 [Naegleria gruberi]EFC38740.1 predicted protein [Naegleria gruberi]|eukprot:XP_002671484.1 predicted protein [Naegleria gruberi strain NEG-M]
MKYESYTEQMNSVPLKKRFHSQSKTSPTHPEFNMTTSPTQHSPQPTTPPTIINTTTTPPPSDNNNQNTLDSSNDSMMITTTIDNSTLPPSTPIKEEVKTEKPLTALLSPTSTTIDALASLHLQSVSASNSPSNESTTTTTSSSTCNSSSPEDSGSNRKEPTTSSSSSNTNSSTSSITDSPNSSNKKRRQFINRANKKKEDKGDSDSGEDSDDSENDSSEEDETLYCKCNRPASYGWMIACDRCDKYVFFTILYLLTLPFNRWFHGRCLGLKKYQANSIGTYICPDCETSKKRKSTSINPSPSKSGRNNRSETTASSLAKDLPPKQITNHL